MALDTRNKRSSAIGWGLGFLRVLPAPDGTVDTSDRKHVAWSYAGIAAGATLYLTVTPTDALVSSVSLSDALVSSVTVSDALAT